ncbi:MAG: hypothetical protein ACRDU0_11250, partial [Mycobacterium sp.]
VFNPRVALAVGGVAALVAVAAFGHRRSGPPEVGSTEVLGDLTGVPETMPGGSISGAPIEDLVVSPGRRRAS